MKKREQYLRPEVIQQVGRLDLRAKFIGEGFPRTARRKCNLGMKFPTGLCLFSRTFSKRRFQDGFGLGAQDAKFQHEKIISLAGRGHEAHGVREQFFSLVDMS